MVDAPKRTTFKLSGRVGESTPERLITVATDAAVGEEGLVSVGYLSSHGHYGLRAQYFPERVSGLHAATVGELRAVLFAVERVYVESGKKNRPVRILTDSKFALDFLREWRQGSERMPEGYSLGRRLGGGLPSLLALSRKLARCLDISVRLVQGHSGHPLNETADSLAKLGLRTQRDEISEHVARGLVPTWVERGHAEYLRSLESAPPGA